MIDPQRLQNRRFASLHKARSHALFGTGRQEAAELGVERVTEVAAWKRRTLACALLLLLLTVWAARLRAHSTALYLVQSQDVPVLFLESFGMLLVAFWRPKWPLLERLPSWWAL